MVSYRGRGGATGLSRGEVHHCSLHWEFYSSSSSCGGLRAFGWGCHQPFGPVFRPREFQFTIL
eukprot:1037327-Pyramimonas_sp.AAC.1